jgi:KUP system potassium uptake protein
VFLALDSTGAPSYFSHRLDRVRALPETVVALTLRVEHVPAVADVPARYVVEDLGCGIHRMVARFGFMEQPDVPALVARAVAERKLPPIDAEYVTFYLGRETILGGPGGRMGTLSEGLFSFLSRNAADAAGGFCIPPGKVVELGVQVDL